jgi:hypothetical protein
MSGTLKHALAVEIGAVHRPGKGTIKREHLSAYSGEVVGVNPVPEHNETGVSDLDVHDGSISAANSFQL